MVAWDLRSQMLPLTTLLAQLGARPGLGSHSAWARIPPSPASSAPAAGGGEGQWKGAHGTEFSIKGRLSRHPDSNLAPLLPDYVRKEFSLCGAQGMLRVTVIQQLPHEERSA